MSSGQGAAPRRLTISTIAEEIRREHQAVEAGVRATLDAAIRCGNLLREAKSQLPHGTWGDWLAKNFPASDRTARVYMRLAEGWGKSAAPAEMTIADALTQLEAPKVKRPNCNKLVRKARPHDGLPLLKPTVNETAWQRQRMEKVQERFALGIGGSLRTLARGVPLVRDERYYGSAISAMSPDDLREYRREIKLARANLLDLDNDLEQVLDDVEAGTTD